MAEISLFFLGLSFVMCFAVAYFLGQKIGKFSKERYWQKEVLNHRKDAILRSRAVLKGQFSEQLAPYFPDFEYHPSDCRFIGKPIDFIVFEGSNSGEISEVIFVEVKSGKSKLSKQEKGLKSAIEEGRVRWEEYRVPD